MTERRVPERVQEEIPESVAIVGVGGVGSWMALFISQMKDVKRIALFDADVVEESNLERTPFKSSHISEEKTEAMKDLIEERRGDVIVKKYGNLTDDNKQLLNMYEMSIACADSIEARNIVLRRDNSVSAGYDVTEEYDHISVHESGEIWTTEEGGADGYTIEPSWSVPAVLVAILTLYQIGQDTRPIDISGKLREFMVRGVNGRLMFEPEPTEDSIEGE